MAALALGEGSAAWLLVVAVLFASCLVVTGLRPSWRLRPALATGAILLLIQGFVFEVLASDAFLVPAAHFLVLFQLVLLTQERTSRNYGLVCVMALIHMMLAGVLSVDMAFGVCLVVFVPAGVAALALLNLRRELERSGSATDLAWHEGLPRGRMLATLGLVSLGELALMVVVFLHFPRFGLQLFQLRPVQRGPALTGFSDRVRLGDLGRILDNAQAVMAARVSRDGAPVEPDTLPILWRGIAHDTYEDGEWSTRHYIRDSASQPLSPERPFVPPGAYLLRGDKVIQEITLEPVTSRVLFYLPHLAALGTATPNLDSLCWHAETRTASSARGSSVSLRYTVTSVVPSRSLERLRRRRKPNAHTLAHLKPCLQLPASIGPGVGALAQRVVGSIPDDAWYDRAKAIEAYLKGHYEYTLAPRRAPTGVDPVEHFLLAEPRGHCEHFASAMAVMLRSVGIPSRVVTGFRAGDWNEYGRFYLVRQRHAHAWVEAYMPSVHDWEPFDPTPPTAAAPPPPEGFLARLDRRLAYLRLAWNSYVVNYSAQEQRELAGLFQRLLAGLPNALPSWGRDLLALDAGSASAAGLVVLTVVGVLLAAAAGLVAVGWLRRRRRGWAPGWAGRARGFYGRLEAALRRRGFRRLASQTPLEFAAAVVAAGGEGYAPARVVAEAFCRARYGGKRLSAPEWRRVRQALAAIERKRR